MYLLLGMSLSFLIIATFFMIMCIIIIFIIRFRHIGVFMVADGFYFYAYT